MPIVTNKSHTSDFLQLFIKHKICSTRQFYNVLKDDEILKQHYLTLPYNMTQPIINKRLTIAQSNFTITTYKDKINCIPDDNDKLTQRLTSLLIEFFSNISTANGLPGMSFLNQLFKCLNYIQWESMAACHSQEVIMNRLQNVYAWKPSRAQ